MFDMTRAARPAHRRLQPGRADEDGAGARAGARPGQHRPRRADQRPRRARHPRPARQPALAAHAGGRRQVHRLLDPHHAGGRAAVRQRRRRRATAARWPAARSPSCSAQTGQRDFEEAFVTPRLRADAGAPAWRRCRHEAELVAAVSSCSARSCADALRDRRTLVTVLVSSVLLGPLVLLARLRRWSPRWSRAPSSARSTSPASAHAPTLQQLPRAPDLHGEGGAGRLRGAAAQVEASPIRWWWCPRTSRPRSLRGDAPVVEIVSDSANQRSEAATARIERLLDAFSRERAVLSLALRGVARAGARADARRGARPRRARRPGRRGSPACCRSS